ncbi:MAG: MgtC/SapB family protein [Kiritimatiellae bacterium]|nr:MgtC/SapB family protein [Kiritimatiellia bacterium]
MNELAEMVLRLALAGVLGGVIGAEREYRGKVAGTRTHLLVALGSALMLLVSQHGFGAQGDPGRVAAQIVSGIGFIGAGAIMVDRKSVHGLTTAAGIWVAAGIGMATAAGLYGLAIATTVLALVGLEVFGIILFNDRRRRQDKGEQNEISDG